MKNASEKLLELILPKDILDYFYVSETRSTDSRVDVYLEEKNESPIEYKGHKLESKGFYAESTAQDFPIRGKSFYCHFRRRRWLNHNTGEIVYRDWNKIAKGTRLTKDFAFFFERAFGQESDKR